MIYLALTATENVNNRNYQDKHHYIIRMTDYKMIYFTHTAIQYVKS